MLKHLGGERARGFSAGTGRGIRAADAPLSGGNHDGGGRNRRLSSDAHAGVRGSGGRHRAGDRRLHLDGSANPSRPRADAGRGLENAIQHGGDQVTVQVGQLEGDGFYVADDGSDFADGIGEQLFEWGWSDEGGTGIGLALVWLVADRHDWDVRHSGEDGARFEFRP